MQSFRKTLPSLWYELIVERHLSLSPIPRLVHPPSMNVFTSQIFNPRRPHLIEGIVSQWPAFEKWNLEYLLQVAGPRTVPIEVGATYMSQEFTQKMMTLEKFVNKYIDAKKNTTHKLEKKKEQEQEQEQEKEKEQIFSPMAYLAQHELFDQIPQLSRDIIEPDYCILSDDIKKKELTSEGDEAGGGGGDEGGEGLIPVVQRNSWFGPAGTVSPLHHDRNHNLFCQVFGSKSILLIDPLHSSMLYCNDGIHSNTSRVDFQKKGWHERWPNVIGVPCMLVTVAPGEMLYIPPKWWHFCVAEETSFSVSYWW